MSTLPTRTDDALAPPPEKPEGASSGAPAPGEVSFARLIGTSTAVKLVMDTAVQIFNPFLGIIAAGLGTNVVVMGRLVSLRSSMGLFAPAFSGLADRLGYRRTIRLSLTLAAAGMLLIGVSPTVWIAAIGMAVMGLGSGSFLPILQAYLSTRLPYTVRARGLGIVEYAWALTGIVGLSLVGLLIAATSWRVPFVLLALLLLVAGWVVRGLPPTHHAAAAQQDTAQGAESAAGRGLSPVERVRRFFAIHQNARSTYSTIAAGALNYFGAMQLMLIHGAWLSDRFGLGAAALGTVALVLGVGDLVASVSVSLFTDRIGKRRSVLLGTAVAIAGYLLLPRIAGDVTAAVLGILLARAGFEFTIVSHFPLLSEQAPAQRAKVMTLGSAILLLLATGAGFTAPWLYLRIGIGGVTALSALVSAVAFVILLVLVRERGTPK